jgi:hypothetical protein
MNPKIKAFDCVEESRKWREATSARLNAMSPDEELAYLQALGERVRAELRGPSGTRAEASTESLLVREDPGEYSTKSP